MSAIVVPSRVFTEFSKLWVRKQLTYFRLFDAARSGVISDSDVFRKVGERTLAALPQIQLPDVHPVSSKMWQQVFEPAATYTTAAPQVSWQSFITERFKAASDQHRDADREAFEHIIDSMFTLADVNKDGVIQRPEYLKLMATLGLGDNQAFTSFSAVDINSDDIITASEFRQAMFCFLYGVNDRRGCRILGELATDDIVISPDMNLQF